MGAPIVALSVCIGLIFFLGILAPDEQQGLSDGLRVFLTDGRIVPSPGAILNTSSFTATRQHPGRLAHCHYLGYTGTHRGTCPTPLFLLTPRWYICITHTCRIDFVSLHDPNTERAPPTPQVPLVLLQNTARLTPALSSTATRPPVATLTPISTSPVGFITGPHPSHRSRESTPHTQTADAGEEEW